MDPFHSSLAVTVKTWSSSFATEKYDKSCIACCTVNLCWEKIESWIIMFWLVKWCPSFTSSLGAVSSIQCWICLDVTGNWQAFLSGGGGLWSSSRDHQGTLWRVYEVRSSVSQRQRHQKIWNVRSNTTAEQRIRRKFPVGRALFDMRNFWHFFVFFVIIWCFIDET